MYFGICVGSYLEMFCSFFYLKHASCLQQLDAERVKQLKSSSHPLLKQEHCSLFVKAIFHWICQLYWRMFIPACPFTIQLVAHGDTICPRNQKHRCLNPLHGFLYSCKRACHNPWLGGGFKNELYILTLGGDDPLWLYHIFQKGVLQPSN